MDGVKTDGIRLNTGKSGGLDRIDRRILGALADDASLSYAALGEIAGLSPPAVHDRVKRLKARGVIQGTHARLSGDAVGKPLLAFVHVDTTGWGKTTAVTALSDLPELEELHSATGDACLILKVRVASTLALEGFLARVYDVPGVTRTRTFVALSTHLERSVQAGVTSALEEGPFIK